MKITKKILAVILSVTMVFSIAGIALNAYAKDDVTPVLFVPGIGQSQTYKYDDEGNVIADWNLLHPNTDFSTYSLNDWMVFVKFVGEFVVSLSLQRDVIEQSSINSLLKVLFSDHLRDENGEFINNVVTPNYACSVADYNEEARDVFDSRIPCQSLIDEIGAENVYSYNYSVFSNTVKNAKGLNDYIENVVLPQTHADKVILVPMSMGATVVNEYMNLYPDAGRIEKVISIVGCWDGSDVFADLMMADFDENAPDLVYTEAINSIGLGDEYLGFIINIAARILPKQEVDNILEGAVQGFVETLILTNTSFISLCPSDRYDAFAEKYLSDPELASVKAETDSYALAQKNLKQRFKYQETKYGTEFYFIAGYDLKFGDCDYGFFHYFESYDTTNSDEVIQISSTAPGTSYVPAGTKFSDEYINNPAHNVSPDGSIDASTCYYEDTTWYFQGQKHELTFNNNALTLAFKIALNEIKTVNDCPTVYPQFNGSRDIKRLERDYIPDAENILATVSLDEASKTKLEKAVKDAEDMIDRTICNREADDAIIKALYDTLVEINGKYNVYPDAYQPETTDTTTEILTVMLEVVSKAMLAVFGEKGFADIFIK